MKFLKLRNAPNVQILTMLSWLLMIMNFNIAYASLITVKVEDALVPNWDAIQTNAAGFGSSGPVSLNWDPNKDLFTELLAYDKNYSGGAAAFCWYGVNCALQLSLTSENTAIHLQSFDLGYYGFGNYIKYSVIDLATHASVLSGSPWVDGKISSLINVDASSNKGFMILFGPDGFNGGINNITYSYNSTLVSTPIPATAWLFGFGLIGIISFRGQVRGI